MPHFIALRLDLDLQPNPIPHFVENPYVKPSTDSPIVSKTMTWIGAKVHLKLFVKVDEKWKENTERLRVMGLTPNR